jgi:antitoxin (DNA-binding transcriptional repressor) of toxin-antitoxin stability system
LTPCTITATQLAKSLSDVLNRIRYRGEEFVVERNGEAIAKLGPVEPAGIKWKELLERYPDLPRPDDTFADDLERIQAEMNRLPAQIPEWPN